MSKLIELADLGQAVWLDYIRRSFTRTGKLKELVEQGVRGVTSNPTIFDKAIRESDDYDQEIQGLIDKGLSVAEIYETLAVTDIREAADELAVLYEKTGGVDGYVSLEVDPTLAHDTDSTIAEATRLFEEVNRPNLMIKIPATPAGMTAIESTIASGINVNATLIFSIEQYEAVAKAYLAGLEERLATGKPINSIASVASFFVSRVDTAVDAELEKIGNTELQGKIAIDNARLAQARCLEIFSGERWDRLVKAGAQVQRPLWASTGTKNPNYSDTLYVDSLIGPDTVNTIPPATLDAFLDHGQVADTLGDDLEGAQARMKELERLDINLLAITDKLLEKGVELFAGSFESLIKSIEEKRERFLVN
ncbi:MAG: transaldolase [Planctomycetia bacterium]|jgi:transaldolase